MTIEEAVTAAVAFVTGGGLLRLSQVFTKKRDHDSARLRKLEDSLRIELRAEIEELRDEIRRLTRDLDTERERRYELATKYAQTEAEYRLLQREHEALRHEIEALRVHLGHTPNFPRAKDTSIPR